MKHIAPTEHFLKRSINADRRVGIVFKKTIGLELKKAVAVLRNLVHQVRNRVSIARFINKVMSYAACVTIMVKTYPYRGILLVRRQKSEHIEELRQGVLNGLLFRRTISYI